MEYIKFKKIDKGYLIKKTGKVVTKEQLKGLRNRLFQRLLNQG